MDSWKWNFWTRVMHMLNLRNTPKFYFHQKCIRMLLEMVSHLSFLNLLKIVFCFGFQFSDYYWHWVNFHVFFFILLSFENLLFYSYSTSAFFVSDLLVLFIFMDILHSSICYIYSLFSVFSWCRKMFLYNKMNYYLMTSGDLYPSILIFFFIDFGEEGRGREK